MTTATGGAFQNRASRGRKSSGETTHRLGHNNSSRCICALLLLVAVGCSPQPVAESPAFETDVPRTPSQSSPEQITLPGPAALAEPVIEPSLPPPEPIFRPSDRRPQHDDARAAELGIARYESRRLLLYTDIEPEIASTLPRLMDQAYEVWAGYFGDLPPDRDGTDFQMTGYIMRERDRFIAAGMLPENLPDFPHGRHRGAEFWMNDQPYEYYRRHLLLHEGTHCFMTIMPERRLPIWYLEGMAELFATHTLDESGRGVLGVMPHASEAFIGFGRVQMLRQAIASGNALTIEGVTALGTQEFSRSFKEPYAWSWALCRFLESHPRYRDRFHDAAVNLDAGDFSERLAAAYAPDMVPLQAEWSLFTRTIDYGYDVERHVIDFAPALPLPAGKSLAVSVSVSADRGWQPTGVTIEAGCSYRVTADGRVTLAQTSKPWASEAQGISIEYAEGKPIGRLIGCVYDEARGQFSEPLDIGPQSELRPDATGHLYLRVNDHADGLKDNSSSYRVSVERLSQ